MSWLCAKKKNNLKKQLDKYRYKHTMNAILWPLGLKWNQAIMNSELSF